MTRILRCRCNVPIGIGDSLETSGPAGWTGATARASMDGGAAVAWPPTQEYA